jgi:hypothetical protein
MAAYHLAAIRKHTPHGPYFLGGYCIGAVVAMEIAQQMVREGETIAHLFLVDPPPGGAGWLQSSWYLIDFLGNARGWGLQKKIDFYDRYFISFNRWMQRPLARKLSSISRRLGIRAKTTANSTLATTDIVAGDIEILDSLEYALYFLAYRLYKFTSLSVPTTFYFPESLNADRAVKRALGSKLDAGNYRVETLRGNHETCLSIHSAILAEKMKEALEKT